MATIKEIQQRLELVTDLADPFLAEAANDQRSGVQKAIEKRKRAIQAELDEDCRLEQMLRYEKKSFIKPAIGRSLGLMRSVVVL